MHAYRGGETCRTRAEAKGAPESIARELSSNSRCCLAGGETLPLPLSESPEINEAAN
jgi:hypothetical protein